MSNNSALKGIRVADFGHVLAGPYCSMLLSTLGAEVIKIETRARPDEQRAQHGAGDVSDLESNSNFLEVNLNKLSVSLNLTTDEGKELARQIVAVSDVVVENMRPGVMDKLGLGYEDLVKVKPDIIMIALSGFGQTGPLRTYSAYNPCFTSVGGLAHLCGYPEKKPNTMNNSGGDARAGNAGVFSVLMALNMRQRTGQGQYIDQSSCEVINSMVGDQMMDYAMNRRSPKRTGNRDAVMAPHNCYRCKGDDAWISIAVSTEAEWQALCEAMGQPQWRDDDAFASAMSRLQNQTRLDELIQAWTIEHDAVDLMRRLQALGVPAMPSFKAEQLFNDAHMLETGAVVEVRHPVLGKRKTITPPWRLSETPATFHTTAPLLGEHNDYVFTQLLKLPEAKIARLMEEKVIY
ncbi:CoA transferase [Caballeronia sp. ATUFL_M1_KS5A]|uniref:CaiB/BaiF CoA transferase family protein n=1 Tax=Caballeronia sp. ATUFL_M1_KS5A TaxID=2921778 RepID=UPI0020280FF7|nr:CoA transferase [Caballeronia sp. ATUFL_M1_KS5A]